MSGKNEMFSGRIAPGEDKPYRYMTFKQARNALGVDVESSVLVGWLASSVRHFIVTGASGVDVVMFNADDVRSLAARMGGD